MDGDRVDDEGKRVGGRGAEEGGYKDDGEKRGGDALGSEAECCTDGVDLLWLEFNGVNREAIGVENAVEELELPVCANEVRLAGRFVEVSGTVELEENDFDELP